MKLTSLVKLEEDLKRKRILAIIKANGDCTETLPYYSCIGCCVNYECDTVSLHDLIMNKRNYFIKLYIELYGEGDLFDNLL